MEKAHFTLEQYVQFVIFGQAVERLLGSIWLRIVRGGVLV